MAPGERFGDPDSEIDVDATALRTWKNHELESCAYPARSGGKLVQKLGSRECLDEEPESPCVVVSDRRKAPRMLYDLLRLLQDFHNMGPSGRQWIVLAQFDA